ncbi:MAG: sensor histidine kinase [Solirubrobacteraceae bacterium]
MNRHLRRLPVRLRLTLVFAGLMAVLLTALGLFLYHRFESGLDGTLDQQLHARAGEVAGLARTADLTTGDPLRRQGDSFAQIIDRSGAVVASGTGSRKPLLTVRELARATRQASLLQRKERSRLYAIPIDGGRRVVVVGVSLSEHEHALEILGATLALGGPLALLIASVAGYLIAAAALRPVESMRKRAATISSGDTGARLPLPESIDEIHRLGSTLNEMLARLEQGLEHERAFVADASHELRSPLAVLKAELEVGLMENGSAEDLRATVSSAIEETERLTNLAESLLVLASAEQGLLALNRGVIYTVDLLGSIVTRFSSQASRAGRSLTISPGTGGCIVGDGARLEQALGNLVENALRYGEGRIAVCARAAGGTIELHVTDEGSGFPADFLPAAFDRFTRADPSRPRGGAGLGLAIVRVIAEAHGGRVDAANHHSGGADVWITLPATERPPNALLGHPNPQAASH